MIVSMPVSENTRRWPRVPVDMPVRVVTSKGFSTTVVEGRGTELSEGGMVLYAGILLSPGDLLEIEFDSPAPSAWNSSPRFPHNSGFLLISSLVALPMVLF
jgi:hypothetical protein